MSGGNPVNKPTILKEVKLWWYGAALLPILAFLGAALAGWLPAMVAPFALFFLFFWVFSFIMALVTKFMKPKRPLP